jgi:Protein of unknown function (DUF2934)
MHYSDTATAARFGAWQHSSSVLWREWSRRVNETLHRQHKQARLGDGVLFPVRIGEGVRVRRIEPRNRQFLEYADTHDRKTGKGVATDMKSRKARKVAVTSRASTSGNQAPHPTRPTVEEIRRRAYEIYVKRGWTDGQHLEDWFQAEKELTETLRKRTAD